MNLDKDTEDSLRYAVRKLRSEGMDGAAEVIEALLPGPETLEDVAGEIVRLWDGNGLPIHPNSVYHRRLRDALARRKEGLR